MRVINSLIPLRLMKHLNGGFFNIYIYIFFFRFKQRTILVNIIKVVIITLGSFFIRAEFKFMKGKM